MKTMTIGIDVHSIGSRKGGNETYYRELITGLSQLCSEHRFLLYHTNPIREKDLALGRNFSLLRLFPGNPALRIPFTMPWRARQDRLDVFHAMYVLPPYLQCKTVTTVADIAYEHFPKFFPAHELAWFKTMVPLSVRNSDHVITVSEYSKTDIARTYRIREDKITVTHEGAGKQFFPRDKDVCKEQLARRYGIEGDFVLYLGRLQARKNLIGLVNAFARVHKGGLPHKLVLAGKIDSMFSPVLSRIRKLGLEQSVLVPGYIADEDVPIFYNAADVFTYPSFFEGFGLPVIEAMACGTPVLTSRGSSLEEVAGDAAWLVEPSDEISIAETLRKALEDPELRARMGQAGLTRSKMFSFRNAARQTIAVYERMMGEEIGPAEKWQAAIR
jgi:glycosyltransferase involved in cell wall biosynthesis